MHPFLAAIGKLLATIAVVYPYLYRLGMESLSTKAYAEAHGLSERTVRNYCV